MECSVRYVVANPEEFVASSSAPFALQDNIRRYYDRKRYAESSRIDLSKNQLNPVLGLRSVDPYKQRSP